MRRNAGRQMWAATFFLITAAACGASTGGGEARGGAGTPVSTTSAQAIKVLALGDSDTTGIGDPSGAGWVGRYASLLRQGPAAAVSVDNLAVDGKTSDQLRSDVARSEPVRQALREADVVLIGIGGADLNAGDEARSAGRCQGRACYAPVLARFGENLAAVAVEVRHLAPHALLRAISLPDAFPGGGSALPPSADADLSRYQVATERTLVCRAVQQSGGRCVDVPRAFNGPAGDGDAYTSGLMTKDPCCYPSSKGQQLIARLLLETGTDGLVGRP